MPQSELKKVKAACKEVAESHGQEIEMKVLIQSINEKMHLMEAVFDIVYQGNMATKSMRVIKRDAALDSQKLRLDHN